MIEGRASRKSTLTIALCLALFLILLSPVAWALDPHRALDHYGYQVWRTDSGLPQNTVRSVLQTADGYLWLGTEGGLVRFDGIDFVTFNVENTPQFQSDLVYDLQQDAQGALWISTGTGLLRYQAGTFTAYTMRQGLPAATVWFSYQDTQHRLWAMTAGGPAWLNGNRFLPVADAQAAVPLNRQAVAEDGQGGLWLGSNSGVFLLQPGSDSPRLAAHLLTGVPVQALVFAHQALWIGSNEGLYRWTQGAVSPVLLGPAAAKPEITALLATAEGTLWMGTSDGITRLTAQGAPDGSPVQPFSADGHRARADRFFRDRQGTVWASTDRGVLRWQGERWQGLAPGSELASNRVLAFFEDREGDLWLGTESGGLNLLRDQKFITYSTRDGLSGNFVRSVFQGGDGTLWIGTDGAGLNRRTASGFAHYSTADGLSSNVILALASGAGRDLWVGTPDGLNLLHPTGTAADNWRKVQVTRFTAADGLPDDFIRSLYTDRDGSLWIGTRHGLGHRVGGKFTSYSMMEGLGSDLIGVIFRDGAQPGTSAGRFANNFADNLWIGTSGGLSRLRDGRFTNLTIPPGLANNTVTTIAPAANGGLWLGTNGGGLHHFGHGIRLAFPELGHALPATIYSMLEDHEGRLWLSAPTGIYRLTLPGRGAGEPPAVAAYGTADGMNIRECSGGGHPAAWRLHDGTLWFATLDGVSVIDPEHAQANGVPPPVVIETVLVDDRQRALEEELTLQPGASRLEFHYAGLSFAAPQKVQYRYRLLGFDHSWIEAGTRRAAFYTNLPPGHYRFQVLAANGDGVWNGTGATLALRLLPHYYQTYWFYAALLLASLLLGYLAYRWRVRQVEAQFGAVLAERGRLAREIHDTLAQGFVGISVHLELVARLLTGGSERSAQPAWEHLDRARALVRESLAEARSSIWDLRSQNTVAEDLPGRLTRSCNRIASGSAAKVYLQVKGTYRPLPRTTEDELLRIAQEAVANAVRHAAATRIDVQLIYEARRMLLQVVDDGRGFAPLPGNNSPDGHYGLRGMQERAAQIGATLGVESAPGKGTHISVEAPLA